MCANVIEELIERGLRNVLEDLPCRDDVEEKPFGPCRLQHEWSGDVARKEMMKAVRPFPAAEAFRDVAPLEADREKAVFEHRANKPAARAAEIE